MSKVSDMLIAAEESQNNDERLAAWKERWRIYHQYQKQNQYDPDKDPEYIKWLEGQYGDS